MTKNNENDLIEYKPQNDKDNPIKIIFVNQSFGDTKILMDCKDTIDELIEFYFKQIGRSDLYNDESILFLIDGKNISPPYPKAPIETLINNVVKSKTIKIIVQDNNDKMKK